MLSQCSQEPETLTEYISVLFSILYGVTKSCLISDLSFSVAKKAVESLHGLFLSSVGCGQSSWQNVWPPFFPRVSHTIGTQWLCVSNQMEADTQK